MISDTLFVFDFKCIYPRRLLLDCLERRKSWKLGIENITVRVSLVIAVVRDQRRL